MVDRARSLNGSTATYRSQRQRYIDEGIISPFDRGPFLAIDDDGLDEAAEEIAWTAPRWRIGEIIDDPRSRVGGRIAELIANASAEAAA